MSRKDYDDGFKDALKTYAHWKNGVEYVGTTGRTLKEAVKDFRSAWNYSPPKERTDGQRND